MPPAAGTPTGAPPPAKETRDPRDVARLVGFAIVAALLIAFIVENSGDVTIHFVFFSAHVSLVWALIMAAVLGALADRLFVWRRRRRRRQKAAQSAQQASR